MIMWHQYKLVCTNNSSVGYAIFIMHVFTYVCVCIPYACLATVAKYLNIS